MKFHFIFRFYMCSVFVHVVLHLQTRGTRNPSWLLLASWVNRGRRLKVRTDWMKPKERKERRGEEGEGCTTLEGVGGGSNNRGRFGGKTETDMESHLFQTDGESECNTWLTRIRSYTRAAPRPIGMQHTHTRKDTLIHAQTCTDEHIHTNTYRWCYLS